MKNKSSNVIYRSKKRKIVYHVAHTLANLRVLVVGVVHFEVLFTVQLGLFLAPSSEYVERSPSFLGRHLSVVLEVYGLQDVVLDESVDVRENGRMDVKEDGRGDVGEDEREDGRKDGRGWEEGWRGGWEDGWKEG